MAVDRKQLKRDYKNSKRPVGVYCVRNLTSGRTWVASSVDLPASLNREKATLRLGGHRLRDLQRDWNEAGEAGFAFEVLDELTQPDVPGYSPAHDLAVLLQLWLERLQPFGERGYNPAPKGTSGLTPGRPLT